ncbi:MAG: VWA domain-containing protein [Pirellulaceae bacterium]
MSFLTPLYVLGLLAISAPILFHLIQRRPKGQFEFSSLMFLSPSPPRLTRRSRLDNLLLLLLRASLLALLAFAFARPFLRSAWELGVDAPARRMVILLDTSASMQQDGVWQAAQDKLSEVVADLRATDRCALVTFDESAATHIRFDSQDASGSTAQRELIQQAAKDRQPTWRSTNLAKALQAAADLLTSDKEDIATSDQTPPQVILISDMQNGANVQELGMMQWPRYPVGRPSVTPTKTNNASLGLVTSQETNSEETDQLRIRVSNAANSVASDFTIVWVDSKGKQAEDREYSVHVPPGQSRVIMVDAHDTAECLQLLGDDVLFDNQLFVAAQEPVDRRLLFVGSDADQAESLWYFLKRVPLSDRHKTVTPEAVVASAFQPDELRPATTPLVILSEPLSADQLKQLDKYLEAGGRVFAVMTTENANDAHLSFWQALLKLDSLTIQPANVDDYAMLSQVDFEHPLFAPFAAPQFADFTKIKVWQHRYVSTNHEDAWETLVRYDNQQVALLEQVRNQGRLWVLTTGWNPQESQLALSTKFIPLLAGMFTNLAVEDAIQAECQVGEPIANASDQSATVTNPADEPSEIAAGQNFTATIRPGVYQLDHAGGSRRIAVNLASAESDTSSFDLEKLEQHGIRLGASQTVEQIETARRQMRDQELESKQQLWRWLVVLALVLVGAETFVAGRRV